jgi:hypothetical protein
LNPGTPASPKSLSKAVLWERHRERTPAYD